MRERFYFVVVSHATDKLQQNFRNTKFLYDQVFISHVHTKNLILLLFSVLAFDNQTVYSSFTLTFSVISECLTIDCYILKRITNQLVDVYIFIWIRL